VSRAAILPGLPTAGNGAAPRGRDRPVGAILVARGGGAERGGAAGPGARSTPEPQPPRATAGEGVNLFASRDSAHEPTITSSQLSALPTDPTCRRRALAALIADNSRWLYALDLFNSGFYWEAHEAWECFWNAFGRTTPEAQFVQGLIHLAAACVKVREGKPAGVSRH
jgi:hypothetical protein